MPYFPCIDFILSEYNQNNSNHNYNQMYICDLPDLCQALVKEALIQEVESIDDPKECLNTGARVAATLALVGNPLFTEYSDDLYDRIVDPGCLQAKRAALQLDFNNRVRWAQDLKIRDHGVPAELNSTSRRRDLVLACKRLSLYSSGNRGRLWNNLLACRQIAEDRFGILENLLRRAPCSLRRCCVRPSARLVIRATRSHRWLSASEAWKEYRVRVTCLEANSWPFELLPEWRVAEIRHTTRGVFKDASFWEEDTDGERLAMRAYYERLAVARRQGAQLRRIERRRQTLTAALQSAGILEEDARAVLGGDVLLDAYLFYPRNIISAVTYCVAEGQALALRRGMLMAAMEVAGLPLVDGTLKFLRIPACRKYIDHGQGSVGEVTNVISEVRFMRSAASMMLDHQHGHYGAPTSSWYQSVRAVACSTETTLARMNDKKREKLVSQWVAHMSCLHDGEVDAFMDQRSFPPSLRCRLLPAIALAFACERTGTMYMMSGTSSGIRDAQQMGASVVFRGVIERFINDVVSGQAHLCETVLNNLVEALCVRQRLRSVMATVSNVERWTAACSSSRPSCACVTSLCVVTFLACPIFQGGEDRLLAATQDEVMCIVNNPPLLAKIEDTVARLRFHRHFEM